MSALVRWAKGGEASIESIGAGAIVLRSTIPSPPGSRIEGTIEAGDGAVAVRVKVHACKREGEHEFVLRGRPVDLTREEREKLEALLLPRAT